MNDWAGIDRVLVDESPHWQKTSRQIFVAALPKS
jgi:hypothetical protein